MTYHYDGLGSARYLSNESGDFTDSYDYEAFGKLLNTEGNTINHYKFTGEQQDEETKQYYLRARYYDPILPTAQETKLLALALTSPNLESVSSLIG